MSTNKEKERGLPPKAEGEKSNSSEVTITKDGDMTEIKTRLETLKCHICNEIMIHACRNGCGHTFCRYCLDAIQGSSGSSSGSKVKINECPTCSAKIGEIQNCPEIDTEIDNLYNSLKNEDKLLRDGLKATRTKIEAELKLKQKEAAKEHALENNEKTDKPTSSENVRRTPSRTDNIPVLEPIQLRYSPYSNNPSVEETYEANEMFSGPSTNNTNPLLLRETITIERTRIIDGTAAAAPTTSSSGQDLRPSTSTSTPYCNIHRSPSGSRYTGHSNFSPNLDDNIPSTSYNNSSNLYDSSYYEGSHYNHRQMPLNRNHGTYYQSYYPYPSYNYSYQYPSQSYSGSYGSYPYYSSLNHHHHQPSTTPSSQVSGGHSYSNSSQSSSPNADSNSGLFGYYSSSSNDHHYSSFQPISSLGHYEHEEEEEDDEQAHLRHLIIGDDNDDYMLSYGGLEYRNVVGQSHLPPEETPRSCSCPNCHHSHLIHDEDSDDDDDEHYDQIVSLQCRPRNHCSHCGRSPRNNEPDSNTYHINVNLISYPETEDRPDSSSSESENLFETHHYHPEDDVADVSDGVSSSGYYYGTFVTNSSNIDSSSSSNNLLDAEVDPEFEEFLNIFQNMGLSSPLEADVEGSGNTGSGFGFMV